MIWLPFVDSFRRRPHHLPGLYNQGRLANQKRKKAAEILVTRLIQKQEEGAKIAIEPTFPLLHSEVDLLKEAS
jgi:hypothetical protein